MVTVRHDGRLDQSQILQRAPMVCILWIYQEIFDVTLRHAGLGPRNLQEFLKLNSEEILIQSKKRNQLSPIFIVGVPRCGSTLVEK